MSPMEHAKPQGNVVYTVTTLAKLEDSGLGVADTGETRCVGWYSEFAEAELAVLENRCDLYEAGGYPYAVVETVEEGLYPSGMPRRFYRYDCDRKRYLPMDEPECVARLGSFGIG